MDNFGPKEECFFFTKSEPGFFCLIKGVHSDNYGPVLTCHPNPPAPEFCCVGRFRGGRCAQARMGEGCILVGLYMIYFSGHTVKGPSPVQFAPSFVFAEFLCWVAQSPLQPIRIFKRAFQTFIGHGWGSLLAEKYIKGLTSSGFWANFLDFHPVWAAFWHDFDHSPQPISPLEALNWGIPRAEMDSAPSKHWDTILTAVRPNFLARRPRVRHASGKMSVGNPRFT